MEMFKRTVYNEKNKTEKYILKERHGVLRFCEYGDFLRIFTGLSVAVGWVWGLKFILNGSPALHACAAYYRILATSENERMC